MALTGSMRIGAEAVDEVWGIGFLSMGEMLSVPEQTF
jgi:hypothetical protein